MSFAMFGLPVSQGIAIGRAQLVSHATLEVSHYTVAPKQVEAELARFDEAIAVVRGELAGLKAASAVGGPSEVGAFVDLHMMILSDPLLCDAPRKIISERRCNAEWALVQEMDDLVAQFDEIEDAYLRERKHDIVQVVERVVKVLLGKPSRLTARKSAQSSEDAAIVIAHDLSPADTIDFKQHKIAGFVTDLGGATSHTAIVARGMSIPAVVGMHHVRQMVQDDDLVIIDGTRGVVIIEPNQQVLEEYRLRKTWLELERSKLKRLKSARSETLDGESIALQANIEQPGDVVQARDVDAAGIGLYRSEFMFLNRDEMPNEDEQFEAYRSVVQAMRGRPVTIRTLDVGADKALRGASRIEANPALGLRAIRYCLAEPKLFLTQLRAILRASHYGTVRLLIPMLSHAHEIEQSLAMIEMAKEQLRVARHRYADDVEVGGMIEIPAAALALGVFLKRLDFLSIGTNDLIQYTLAIDRSDEAVAHLYDPTHPAVLRLIHQTIQTGMRAGLSVAVCGEMAGDPALTRLLIGMGLRQFSMHPAQILEVKQEVLRADASELTAKVARLLRFDEPERLREQLERINGRE